MRAASAGLALIALSLLLPAGALKAAVIGGGLGGLTCCNALRKVGIDAEVYERAAKLSPQAGTGLTLWPNGLSALEAIDDALVPLIKDVGGATTDIEVTSADGLTRLPNPTGDPTRFPSLCIPI
jgi:2-polyprenyl-6-methoxyphenol hydroxylase-like FAD-dependent oxidoreductase